MKRKLNLNFKYLIQSEIITTEAKITQKSKSVLKIFKIILLKDRTVALYLFCKTPRKERNQIFYVELHKTLQMWLHKIHFILLFSQFGQIFRINCVTLESTNAIRSISIKLLIDANCMGNTFCALFSC